MRTLLTLAILVWISKCGFNTAKTVPSEEGVASTPLEATFKSIHDQIFVPQCLDCHSPGHVGKRVPLNTREDLMNSPRDLVVPSKPTESGLYLAITRTDDKRMPPTKFSVAPLPSEQVEVIRRWILEGAQ